MKVQRSEAGLYFRIQVKKGEEDKLLAPLVELALDLTVDKVQRNSFT
jgi:hypothetical protein